MNTLKAILGNNSKKLSVLIVAGLLVIFKDYFGLNADQVQALEVLAGTYLVGQGVADFGKGAAQIETKLNDKQ